MDGVGKAGGLRKTVLVNWYDKKSSTSRFCKCRTGAAAVGLPTGTGRELADKAHACKSCGRGAKLGKLSTGGTKLGTLSSGGTLLSSAGGQGSFVHDDARVG